MAKIVFVLLATIFISFTVVSYGQETTDRKNELQNKIEEYQKKLVELNQQKNTLASQIIYMDTQMYLTTLSIQATEQQIINTEKEIELLNDRIDTLDDSLNYLSKMLLERIVDGYKTESISLFNLFFDSMDANDFLSKVKYQKAVQDNNQKLLIQVQISKSNFEEQKKLREKKKTELDELKAKLDNQKVELKNQQESKRALLVTTQNDEKTYQTLLARAKAEQAAIQGIISGAGTETLLRTVSKGETIASIIQGASCNSSGSHLHFIVQEGSSVIDPFSKLKSVDNVNETGEDSFNPTGSWDWPVPPTIHLHQGYGVTWFVRTYGWYSFHNGIDISGSSYNVNAVEDGVLYRGSYAGFNGCALQYVKVVHKDSNMSTLYLHVYSQ